MSKKAPEPRVYVCFWRNDERYVNLTSCVTLKGWEDRSEEDIMAEVTRCALAASTYAPTHGDIRIILADDMRLCEFTHDFKVKEIHALPTA